MTFETWFNNEYPDAKDSPLAKQLLEKAWKCAYSEGYDEGYDDGFDTGQCADRDRVIYD